MLPANERRRYIVTSSLIGWVHAQNDPCCLEQSKMKVAWIRTSFYITEHHSILGYIHCLSKGITSLTPLEVVGKTMHRRGFAPSLCFLSMMILWVETQKVWANLGAGNRPQLESPSYLICMIMSWYGNAVRITGRLWGESTDHSGFLSKRTSNGALVLLCCYPTTCWANNRVTDDLRHHYAHMTTRSYFWANLSPDMTQC